MTIKKPIVTAKVMVKTIAKGKKNGMDKKCPMCGKC